jgi:Zn-dependent alcohol dehydrogenase
MLARTSAKYPYDKIVSHKFPLDQINEAFAQQNKGAITRSSLVP